jgi:hypothetical protein
MINTPKWFDARLLTDGTRFSVAVYLRTLGASFKLLVIGG